MSKIYTVMKDGEILRELKTLPAAKKLADKEEAEVFDGGICVYAPDPVIGDLELEDLEEDEPVPVIETVTPDRYRLLHKMNVREAPSLKAEKVGTKAVGDIVSVLALENDWMQLADGTFILFGEGRFAEKIRKRTN